MREVETIQTSGKVSGPTPSATIRMPATPAIPAPRAQTSELTPGTDIPTRVAAVLFWEAACMAMPTRVKRKKR